MIFLDERNFHGNGNFRGYKPLRAETFADINFDFSEDQNIFTRIETFSMVNNFLSKIKYFLDDGNFRGDENFRKYEFLQFETFVDRNFLEDENFRD